MSNKQRVREIMDKNTFKNDVEESVTKDVKQRIFDWLSYSNTNINDDYITKQIEYFDRYQQITNLGWYHIYLL